MAVTPEVLIVGAGPAGLAAAIKLARAGVRVLVLEGATFAGAENWSGCVYHGDAWARPDLLGDEWRRAPRERRIVSRSLFVHDGLRAVGLEARAVGGNDYGDAWTVLRPKLDRWLATRAIDSGVILLPATMVTGLRYDDQGRVVGVNTERGPIQADVVFLAEGDAAGLVSREGLERQPHPHYAQGIKAVFALAPAEIERRFGLQPEEGVAQEWLLRNGTAAGRPVDLNATAFLYTNRASLSVGLVLPLDHLARHAVADHAHLLQRTLATAGIARHLEGARQVAYGAKVIRAGGVGETPEWIRDGLAVGGGPLGLGMEFPYPNFIGPAITSGVVFAEAVLLLRAHGDYSRAALEREYAQRLRETDDYANADLLKRWPAAIHQGRLLFGHAPALLGQLIDAQDLPPHERRAQVDRAFAVTLRTLGADLDQARLMLGAVSIAARASAASVPPLDVRFLATDSAGALVPIAMSSRLLARAATAFGHFYGRRLPMRARLARIRATLHPLDLALLREAAALTGHVAAGGIRLLGDLAAYRFRKLSLRALLLRPYHGHEEATRRELDWGRARRTTLSPLAWLAPMDRRYPDARHIAVPLTLDHEAARALRHVCPAEVYTPTSRWGGVATQYENCIKCESCRVTVPGIDWNRTSGHRLSYRLPDDERWGLDGSATGSMCALPVAPVSLGAIEEQHWRLLLSALRARAGMVDAEMQHHIRDLWRGIPVSHATRSLHARVGLWLERQAFGWIENEVSALLTDRHPNVAYVLSEDQHRSEMIVRGTHALRAFFTPSRLRELATRSWNDEEHAHLHEWIAGMRAQSVEAVERLAAVSPALAWIAANHYLAEASAGRALDTLSTVIGRSSDGLSHWVPGVVRHRIDARGKDVRLERPCAHGAGLDAAQPVRYVIPDAVPALPVTGALAQFALAIACGMWATLRERAVAYAADRVQFRGALQDREGRDSIGKFGAIKAMLGIIEQAGSALRLAQTNCERDPAAVLALVRDRMGVRMDGVPWLAGQIFGGMAYSEEDVLAPRYRDALLLAHWPASAEDETDAGAFQTRLHRAALMDANVDYVHELDYRRIAEGRLIDPHASPALARPAQPYEFAASPRRGRPLTWDARSPFTYRSGSFLHGSLLAPVKLLLPEHFRRDPRLRATRADVLRLLRGGFRSPRHGEPYGRYIDARHGIPDDDIERLRAFNAFATVVPEHLGGKGWSKAQYAVMNMLTMGNGDTSLGLLIMASTSIGTMPVILGLDKDLPRVERELRDSLADTEGWQRLEQALAHLRAMLARPQPKVFKEAMTAWAAHAQRMFMAPGSALKYLARDFLLALQRAGDLAKARDLDALSPQLETCERTLAEVRGIFIDELAELPARRAAHQRFLRFLATGQISAFALTEPVAGSDTGGIQTRAVLRSVPVQAGPQGTFRFVPHGTSESRTLLDAERIEFDGRQVVYRLPDGDRARLDESDWGLARNQGHRLLRAGTQTLVYHDIGIVSRSDDGWVYRYWEVTGSKMWITNGAIADRYSFYAQTEFGETAFMLDRRSEGLRIGPNENKLGQRASPTNELTLDRVRIGADQLIGYRGHGQVSALETLSVGRGGLVMGCATLVDRVLREYRDLWRAHPDLHRAALFEHERLQTLAARLVGLMDRVDLNTGDFRIEAALSKYLASEGAHRVLLWLERIMGPMAAATEHLIEKWRRDARILNIYEGTNEIQRFLVLKDLPQLLASPMPEDEGIGDVGLRAALAAFRAFAAPRLGALGARVWQEPDLQAQWYPVVDWAGELYAWCALYERSRALAHLGDPGDRATVERLRVLMQYMAAHVAGLASRIRHEFETIESGRGRGVSGALLASARRALQARTEGEPGGPFAVGPLAGEWAVILRSRAEWHGQELVWAGWDERDRAVLDRALAWRDAYPQLTIKVAALAPRGVEDHLRRLQAAGAAVLHLVQPPGAADVATAAEVAHTHWPSVRRWAMGASDDGGDIDTVRRIAARLGGEVVRGAQRLGALRRGLWLENDAGARHYVAQSRGALFVWQLRPTGRSDAFTIERWLDALQSPLPVQALAASPATYRTVTGPVREDVPPGFANPAELADWLRRRGTAAGDEPLARVVEASRPLAATTLWLTPSERLRSLERQSALAAARDVADDGFAVVAWHSAGAATVSIAQAVAQAGFQGVWRLPILGGDEPAAAELKTWVAATRRAVFTAGDAALAVALAEDLGWPCFMRVISLGAQRVVTAGDGFVCEQDLPPHAILVIDPDYARSPDVPVPAALVPLASLPTAVSARPSALARWMARATGDGGWTRAPVIIDVGLGIGDAARYAALVPPLQETLARTLRVSVVIGATRKITQELKLLPADRQIGQTGSAVAPRLLFALGVSGAPQHMNWIDKRTLVIAINRDAHAPIFNWQRENGGPHIVRCVGDLDEWIPGLIDALGAMQACGTQATSSVVQARQQDATRSSP